LVEGLDAPEDVKEKLRTILETVTGETTVAQACEKLGVSESRFYQMREEALVGAVRGVMPKPRGRPRKVEETPADEVKRLKKENEDLKEELEFARARVVLATAFPHLIKDPDEKKTNPRKERRKQRKAERKRKKRG
jgi:transposase-like protein